MKKIHIMNIKSACTMVLAVGLSAAVLAQVPIPAKPQSKPVMLIGGTVHTATGKTIANAAVAFQNGKLTYVGTAEGAPADKSAFEVIDLKGQHIYPGFILTNTRLGLVEVESIRATADFDEAGEYNPNVRSQPAYNTDSEHIAACRFNGILLAEPTPTGGVISGTSSVMQLEGWNWEDATHSKDAAVHLNWPGLQKTRFDFETFSRINEPNADYGKNLDEIGSFFDQAIAYGKLQSKEVNLKLKAMQGLFEGTQTLIIHAERAKEMVDGVRLAQSKGVRRIALAAGDEALAIVPFLNENNIPVILPSIHTLPGRPDEDIDLQYAQAAYLSKAGVKVVFSHTGSLGTARNLPFYAGTSVAHGMDGEAALQALTINAARVLGIDGRVGTLEAGKDATLFVSKGDALDFRTSQLTSAYIGGRRIVLDNKHQELYQRYSDKYNHALPKN